jgi:signal transduction histidine kinase
MMPAAVMPDEHRRGIVAPVRPALKRRFLVEAAVILFMLVFSAGVLLYFVRDVGRIASDLSALQARRELLGLAEASLMAANPGGDGAAYQSRQLLHHRLEEGLRLHNGVLSAEERKIVKMAYAASSGRSLFPMDIAAAEERFIGLLESIDAETRALFHKQQVIAGRLRYSVWLNAVALGAVLFLMLWRLEHGWRTCLRIVERNIRLIGSGKAPAPLSVCGSDNEAAYISAALEQMADALSTRQMEQAVASYLAAERKRLRALVNMALGMADEVGNPLTAIDGAIDLLRRCWQENPPKSERERVSREHVGRYFSILHEQTARIGLVLRQTGNFNLFSASQRELSGINEVIQAVVMLVLLDKRLNDVRIDTDLDASVPALVLDRPACALSFLSLIEKAVDAAMITGGGVWVSSGHDERAVTVRIQCLSVDADLCRSGACRLPFCPGEGSTKRMKIEFSMVRSFIESHGGMFTVLCTPGETCGIRVDFPKRGRNVG